MKLTYNNIMIRNACAEDCLQLSSWWNDGNVMAHAGFPMGLGTTPDKVRKEISTDSDETRRRLILLSGEQPIGEMCFRRITPGVADIGIKICEQAFQEKGIGKIALSMMIRYLFETGIEKIILDTNLTNTRAQHVYESLGFRKIRINIDSWTNQLGIPESSVDYELYPENFIDYAV